MNTSETTTACGYTAFGGKKHTSSSRALMEAGRQSIAGDSKGGRPTVLTSQESLQDASSTVSRTAKNKTLFHHSRDSRKEKRVTEMRLIQNMRANQKQDRGASAG